MQLKSKLSVFDGFVMRKNGGIGLPLSILNTKGKTASYRGQRFIKIGNTWNLEKWLADPTHPNHQEY
ncbi:MAG: hypothetical protein J4415_02835 [Candidatus Diapherotrites archaeon]|uniref:Uncharacterized protein n=1 Tax=Candidatus Iainarchaeum sp. TaxID=3101447 RepID=A0A8T4KVG7_9ARCH|nr:hypothetical protein [Candidatus Diapherotrites archaeon]